jgi:hypothetical protein
MDIDTRWVDAVGYRPVRVTMINWPRGPATADRTFRVELEPFTNEWRIFDPKVIGSVELKRGQRAATLELYCPQSYWWAGIDVRVYEGSVELREFESTVVVNQMSSADWSEAVPRLLFISSLADRSRQQLVKQHDFPRWDVLLESIPNFENLEVPGAAYLASGNDAIATDGAATDGADSTNDADVTWAVRLDPRAAIISPPRIPDQWIGLSGIDFIFISSDELSGLKKTRPQKFESLRQWLEVGGHLCVTDVGPQFKKLPAVEEGIGLAASPLTNENSAWTSLVASDYSLTYENAIQPRDNGYPIDPPIGDVIVTEVPISPDASTTPGTLTPDASTPPENQGVPDEAGGGGPVEPAIGLRGVGTTPPEAVAPLVRTVGMGRVFLIPDTAMLKDPAYNNWVFNSLTTNRLVWYEKHGLSLHRHNQSFWNWSIPGIGRTPILLFLFVITVFSVVIGPVNFLIAIKRLKRYYLVLITIPLISVITTVGVLSYGLFRDGLGTKVRRRAYVELNQETGRSHSWSRQTYYPSIGPSGGARFPLNSAIYPISPQPDRPSRNPHTIRWEGSQRLARGYVRPRTLSQFMVVQPAKSTAANIAFSEKGKKLVAKNELGGDITHLIVCDKKGKFHAGELIEDGKSLVLKATAGVKISTAIRRTLLEQGLEPAITGGLVRNTRGYNDEVDVNLPLPDDATSLMETEIAHVRAGVLTTLQPGTYVALLTSSSMVPIGINGSEDRDSLIVVRGKW